jgi:hypothetical protein
MNDKSKDAPLEKLIIAPRVRFELTRPLRVTSFLGGTLQAGALPLDDLGFF